MKDNKDEDLALFREMQKQDKDQNNIIFQKSDELDSSMDCKHSVFKYTTSSHVILGQRHTSNSAQFRIWDQTDRPCAFEFVFPFLLDQCLIIRRYTSIKFTNRLGILAFQSILILVIAVGSR